MRIYKIFINEFKAFDVENTLKIHPPTYPNVQTDFWPNQQHKRKYHKTKGIRYIYRDECIDIKKKKIIGNVDNINGS